MSEHDENSEDSAPIPVPGPAVRRRLNRHERRAAEKLAQTPFFVAHAKQVELRVIEAELHRRYMEEAYIEVFGHAED